MRLFIITLLLLMATILCAQTQASIYDIQYTATPGSDNTYPSPLNGQIVTTVGIVTGINFAKGNYATGKFFIQDESAPWHGIYIFDYSHPVAVGDMVQVTGTVSEYYGLTEIGYVTNVTIVSSGNPVPDPMQVTTAQASSSEGYESCLVRVNNVTVTTAQSSYGEWYVTDGSGDCQVDDGFFYLDDITPAIVPTVGQTWGSITGVVDYGYSLFGINPRTADDLVSQTSVSHNSWGKVKSLYK